MDREGLEGYLPGAGIDLAWLGMDELSLVGLYGLA